MEPYFFTLRHGHIVSADPVGVELAVDEAALDYARLVAAELMKNREEQTSQWRIEVAPMTGLRLALSIS